MFILQALDYLTIERPQSYQFIYQKSIELMDVYYEENDADMNQRIRVSHQEKANHPQKKQNPEVKNGLSFQAMKIAFQSELKENSIMLEQCLTDDIDLKNCDQYTRMLILNQWNNTKKGNKIDKIELQTVLEAVSKVFDHKFKDYLSKMTESEVDYYNLVMDYNNKLRIQESIKLKLFTVWEQLVKIDILALFFRVKHKIKRIASSNSFTIKSFTIARVTGFKQSFIHLYSQNHDDFQQYLTYDFQDQFGWMVSFVILLELRKKLTNLMLNYHENTINSQAQQMEFPVAESPSFIAFSYKFCQVIYLNIGFNIATHLSTSKRCEIIQQLRTISKIEDLSKQKRKFLQLKSRYNVTFASLSQIYSQLTNSSLATSKKYSNELSLFNELLKCRWIFLQEGCIYEKLKRITKMTDRPSNNKFFKNQEYISDFLVRLAKKRFKLLKHVMNLLMKAVFSRNTQYQNMFISRYQYSYNQIKKINGQGNTVKDLKCTLILAMNHSRVFFFIIDKAKEVSIKYLNKLTRVIKGIRNVHRPNLFRVFFNELKPSSIIDWEQYQETLIYFRTQLNSYLYLTNATNLFVDNYVVFALINSYLKMTSQEIKQDNFYQCFEEAAKIIILNIENNLKLKREQQLNTDNKMVL